MSDDKHKVGKPDRDRINIHEDYELTQWSTHFKVSKDKIKKAVGAVGVMVKDVEGWLKKNP